MSDAKSTAPGLPIFVDLDGTLILTDMLDECLARRLADGRVFREFLRYPLWLLGGIPKLKRRLAADVQLDVAVLPINQRLVEYLREQKKQGREIHLLSASNHELVEQVGAHLGFFDSCEGTRSEQNLKGISKVEHIRSRGIDRFVYAGNSTADVPIWREAAGRIFVNAPDSARRQFAPETVEFDCTTTAGRVSGLIRALRVHQWVKNLLIFLPLFAAHRWGDLQAWGDSLAAFAAFCCTASGVYLLNDVIDVESDRRHRTKHARPVAAGLLPIRTALLLHLLLMSAGLLTAFAINFETGCVVSVYATLTTAYSFWLKKLIVVDTVVLTLLYVIRIVAGHVATAIAESFWLYAFSGFLFLSLAFLKRSVELQEAKIPGRVKGRGYETEDAAVVASLGICAGMLSVLVLALYVHSPEVRLLYREPRILWAILPVVLGWISYIWIVARRGLVHEDPVIFAIKDRVSYVLLFLVGCIGAISSIWNR